jgi:hypothetical protein
MGTKKKSMVEVFNQLTHHELADYSLFEELLGNHFEKFRYFYHGTSEISDTLAENVKGISCFCSSNGILVVVEFSTAKNCEKYRDAINEYMDDNYCPGEEYFSFDAEIKGSKKLNISIENKTISREDEIYEDRFNSR